MEVLKFESYIHTAMDFAWIIACFWNYTIKRNFQIFEFDNFASIRKYG